MIVFFICILQKFVVTATRSFRRHGRKDTPTGVPVEWSKLPVVFGNPSCWTINTAHMGEGARESKSADDQQDAIP
jgi:hypothetical protein